VVEENLLSYLNPDKVFLTKNDSHNIMMHCYHYTGYDVLHVGDVWNLYSLTKGVEENLLSSLNPDKVFLTKNDSHTY
jgi:hypothetical protein